MSEKIRVMFSEEQVNEKIKELGAQISADMKGEPVKIICILKGAAFLRVNWQNVSPSRFLLILFPCPVTVTVQSHPVLCVSSKIWMIPL